MPDFIRRMGALLGRLLGGGTTVGTTRPPKRTGPPDQGLVSSEDPSRRPPSH
jgi:hypothetical protein